MTQEAFDQCYAGFTTDGKVILTETFAKSIAKHCRSLSASAAMASSRAFDAAPVSPMRQRIAAFRARMASRAMDRQPEARREPDYSVLERAYAERRGKPAEFQSGISYDSDTERDFARRRYRSANSMWAASDADVDRYIELSRHYEAQRG
ncbi:MAG: hypothetical protein WBY44_28755 [Bryobacteraceae bacterium]